MVSNKMILCAALSNTNFPTWPACFDGVFGVRNYIAKLQERDCEKKSVNKILL